MDWSVPSLELALIIYLDPWECGEVTLDIEKCDPCYLKASAPIQDGATAPSMACKPESYGGGVGWVRRVGLDSFGTDTSVGNNV